MIGVLVHGGAGMIADDRHDAVLAGCRAAAEAGRAVLAAGAAAIDAAQAAVHALEANPEFNAGTGSVLTRAGTIEVDASIMSGDGRVGAVAAVPELGHAIDLARAVYDDGEHVILAGPHAWEFALERGFARAAPGSLETPRSRARFEEARAARARAKEDGGGTVGAVAIDAQGRVAAATSTGGINFKRPGRVGDSPVPGAGTWADERGGAASATGDGEAILRVTLTRQLVDRIVRGAAPEVAAAEALAELVARTHGGAGVIVVDTAGRFAARRSTAMMPVALAVIDATGAERTIALLRPDGALE